MGLSSVALVLASCVLHAYWNLLIKQARDKTAFTALYLTAASVIYLPLFLAFLPGASIPAAGWLCTLGTGVVYCGYFAGLARANEHGDLSVAYPLARGSGPALAFVGGVLLLSERPTLAGTAGVALILTAVVALHRPPGGEGLSGAARLLTAPAGRAALFVGLMYSLYSLIDKTAVARVGVPPALYIYLTFTISTLVLVPWIARRSGMAALRAEWRANGRACVAVGTLNVLAYLLVLYAMSLPGAPVSYVVPLRTASVLFGVLLGVGVLGEGQARARIAAALLMMAGIGLIAWGG